MVNPARNGSTQSLSLTGGKIILALRETDMFLPKAALPRKLKIVIHPEQDRGKGDNDH